MAGCFFTKVGPVSVNVHRHRFFGGAEGSTLRAKDRPLDRAYLTSGVGGAKSGEHLTRTEPVPIDRASGSGGCRVRSGRAGRGLR